MSGGKRRHRRDDDDGVIQSHLLSKEKRRPHDGSTVVVEKRGCFVRVFVCEISASISSFHKTSSLCTMFRVSKE